MDTQTVYAVQLAVDEACSNIIEHAYDEQSPGDIHFTCEVTGSRLRLTLRDTGKPFDPSAVPEPDLACALEDRQVGGLGIYIMRKIMDEVHFEAGELGNTLTLTKHLDRQD
jgi:serine/threonine-protein kinase RsbW